MRWHPTAPWFDPKIFGWGWRPITWQGWLITLILVILLVGILFGVVAFVTGGRPGHTGIS